MEYLRGKREEMNRCQIYYSKQTGISLQFLYDQRVRNGVETVIKIWKKNQ